MDVAALLLAGTLLSPASIPDTTVALRRGDHVVVENLSGRVVVRAWDRGELGFAGDGDRVRDLGVVRSGRRVTVGSTDRKRRGLDVDMELRVPPWVSLEVRGRSVDVTVVGLTEGVQVHTVEGDIVAQAVGGDVTLSTVDGEIRVDGAAGRVTARSRGDDVRLARVRGDVDVSSGSGDVVLEAIEAASVRAETLDGDLSFQGELRRGGSYWFSVHDGDAEVTLPPGAGVRAKVSTFDGEFTSQVPVVLKGYRGGGTFEFVLGDGGASLEIHVFDGEIRLLSGRR